MSHAGGLARFRKFLFAPIAATLLLAVGCQPEKSGPPPGPTPVRAADLSNEVPILVYVVDPSDVHSEVFVVPNSAYVHADLQSPHWIAFQGDITDITFRQKTPGPTPPTTPETPTCNRGHCKVSKPPKEVGTFTYTLSIKAGGNKYTVDPQLIIGHCRLHGGKPGRHHDDGVDR